jgi:hypothetical protein
VRWASFGELVPEDRDRVRRVYAHKVDWIPDEEYFYPVGKDGRLQQNVRRASPNVERASELWREFEVREVMES